MVEINNNNILKNDMKRKKKDLQNVVIVYKK